MWKLMFPTTAPRAIGGIIPPGTSFEIVSRPLAKSAELLSPLAGSITSRVLITSTFPASLLFGLSLTLLPSATRFRVRCFRLRIVRVVVFVIRIIVWRSTATAASAATTPPARGWFVVSRLVVIGRIRRTGPSLFLVCPDSEGPLWGLSPAWSFRHLPWFSLPTLFG